MRQHTKSIWLNVPELTRRGDAYIGVIVSVAAVTVRNPYTCRKEVKPVIEFDDGQKLLPNVGMLRTLMALYGPESDAWVGKRLRVFQVLSPVQRVDKKTGEVVRTYERHVMESIPGAVTPEPVASNGNGASTDIAGNGGPRTFRHRDGDDPGMMLSRLDALAGIKAEK